MCGSGVRSRAGGARKIQVQWQVPAGAWTEAFHTSHQTGKMSQVFPIRPDKAQQPLVVLNRPYRTSLAPLPEAPMASMSLCTDLAGQHSITNRLHSPLYRCFEQHQCFVTCLPRHKLTQPSIVGAGRAPSSSEEFLSNYTQSLQCKPQLRPKSETTCRLQAPWVYKDSEFRPHAKRPQDLLWTKPQAPCPELCAPNPPNTQSRAGPDTKGLNHLKAID